ncbi:MAG: DUF2911 domain-containing protein [Gemmatimonadetes bacterium]|jgi:hypothetical protein|nr:DUF2911 domain-containing protein [Gemmatimonadota bacterium]MBT4611367.1 DUF2911 domain-containing protein [Gemmatimonadota bacterium]MBT5057580.1 DUF2911 domain-containing protein [Gemmatimonadota bacterium]MBT5142685.1 DUF2911 domain-containing protein [Gemmatimonadota bacterium]MBT5587661.1 DUF2911 domain-containing protein [Gemmatimonadota bacterium]
MKFLRRISVLSIVAVLATSALAFGQERGNDKVRKSPNAAVSQTIGTTVVEVTYGRPGLKGRSLDQLVPDGKVWRTGANESAVIRVSNDVMIGDVSVEAGTYSLYTMANDEAGTFTIIINSKLSWGTQHDASKDVARTTVSTSSDNPFAEWFAINFDGLTDTSAIMNLHWGARIAAVPITVK